MRPFSYRDEGRVWLLNLLKDKGFKDLRETDRYAKWDLEGEKDGVKYIFELKNRDFPHWKYNDLAVSYDKYLTLKDFPGKGIFVNFWDDFWTMIDVKTSEPAVFHTQGPKTTRFEDREIVDKTWASWKLTDIHLLTY